MKLPIPRWLSKKTIDRLWRNTTPPRAAISSPSARIHQELRRLSPLRAYSTGNNLTQWQASGRSLLATLLGLSEPWEKKLNKSTSVWEKDLGYCVARKICLEYDDGTRIPVYLATPGDGIIPKGTIICLQGHTSGMHVSLGLDSSEEHLFDTGYKSLNIASQAIKEGYRVVCLEQESLGERREQTLRKIAPHPCHDAAMHRLLLGQTLMAVRVADVFNVIDYLESNDLVEPPLGVMGNSLGGTVSMYAACLNHSIHFAVLSSCVSQLEESLFSIYHCADLYIPRLSLYFDTSDIIGLMACKPLILATGVNDPIFPLIGFRKTLTAVRRIYHEADQLQRVTAVVGHGGHQFYGSLIFPELDRVLRNWNLAEHNRAFL